MDFANMLIYGKEKLIASIPLCFLTIGMEEQKVVFGVIFLIILDTILGIWASILFRRFDSHKLRRLSSKIGQYTVSLISAWIVSTVYPHTFMWLFDGVGIFLMLTEVLSIFEKLALLGMKTPTKLIASVNKEYRKLTDDRAHAEVIMEKRDCIR